MDTLHRTVYCVHTIHTTHSKNIVHTMYGVVWTQCTIQCVHCRKTPPACGVGGPVSTPTHTHHGHPAHTTCSHRLSLSLSLFLSHCTIGQAASADYFPHARTHAPTRARTHTQLLSSTHTLQHAPHTAAGGVGGLLRGVGGAGLPGAAAGGRRRWRRRGPRRGGGGRDALVRQ